VQKFKERGELVKDPSQMAFGRSKMSEMHGEGEEDEEEGVIHGVEVSPGRRCKDWSKRF